VASALGKEERRSVEEEGVGAGSRCHDDAAAAGYVGGPGVEARNHALLRWALKRRAEPVAQPATSYGKEARPVFLW